MSAIAQWSILPLFLVHIQIRDKKTNLKIVMPLLHSSPMIFIDHSSIISNAPWQLIVYVVIGVMSDPSTQRRSDIFRASKNSAIF